MTDRIKTHIDEFRSNDGKLGGFLRDATILLLHHVGAKSGLERVSPLGYQPLDGSYAVFGTNYGKPDHPAWFYNLQAQPDTTIEIGRDTIAVRARIAGEEERDRIWARQIEHAPPMGDYERQAGRKIPVVILEPIMSPSAHG